MCVTPGSARPAFSRLSAALPALRRVLAAPRAADAPLTIPAAPVTFSRVYGVGWPARSPTARSGLVLARGWLLCLRLSPLFSMNSRKFPSPPISKSDDTKGLQEIRTGFQRSAERAFTDLTRLFRPHAHGISLTPRLTWVHSQSRIFLLENPYPLARNIRQIQLDFAEVRDLKDRGYTAIRQLGFNTPQDPQMR